MVFAIKEQLLVIPGSSARLWGYEVEVSVFNGSGTQTHTTIGDHHSKLSLSLRKGTTSLTS